MKNIEYNRSRSIALEIAKHYTIADEIALNRKEATDPEKIAYLAYVQQCKDKFPQ